MSRRSTKTNLITAVLVVAGVTALAAAGAAAFATFPSSVTIDTVEVGPHSVDFAGTVGSEKAKCVKGRKVSVHEMKGAEPGDHDALVGPAATSDEDGGYQVSGHHPPADGDKFYAVVDKRKFGRKGHKKTCAAAQSNIYTYED